MILYGPRAIFSKKSHFAKISKNARYVCSNCVKTVNVRNNFFTGLSNESIANILVKKMSSLSPSVLEMKFCPNMGMGVAIFGFLANILKFVITLKYLPYDVF